MDKTAEIAVDHFMQPYHDAGHDLPSLFKPGPYRCERCGAYQIDLSEDLVYGEMRKCQAQEQSNATGS